MATTSPWLTSTSTGDWSFWAALHTAISVSWLSTLNAPTANFWLRLRCMRWRARTVLSRICLIVSPIAFSLKPLMISWYAVDELFCFHGKRVAVQPEVSDQLGRRAAFAETVFHAGTF